MSGASPTDRQRALLAAYLRLGSRKAAAAELGISVQTAGNTLGLLYRSLGVGSAIGAAKALGWLEVPEQVA